MGLAKEQVMKGIGEAAERMGLDLEDLVEMIPDVLSDGLQKSQNILTSIASEDWAVVKDVAHDIKGAFRNYGLDEAGELAFQIEKDPSGAGTKEVTESLVQMIEEITAYGIGE